MQDDPDPRTGTDHVSVFQGTRAACAEAALVLEAKGIAFEAVHIDGGWMLSVPMAFAAAAREEIIRYGEERGTPRPRTVPFAPFPGAAAGAIAYAVLLLLVAWCAGERLFGVDWLEAGALEAGAAAQAWRAVTALTLHLDQLHLLGNLLFGIGIGVLAGRVLGPGVAWLGILLAAASANLLEMLISPPDHRAAGASTAVFAALGLLSGFAWRRELSARARKAYRFGPLFAGVCLLALLGAGDAKVDVLGHVLGFGVGILLGWVCARARVPRSRGRDLQWAAGALALGTVVLAWVLAIVRAGG